VTIEPPVRRLPSGPAARRLAAKCDDTVHRVVDSTFRCGIETASRHAGKQLQGYRRSIAFQRPSVTVTSKLFHIRRMLISSKVAF
jgi:hypothetical protein